MMNPTRYDEVKNYMSQFVMDVKGDPTLKNPLAFVLIRNSLVGECYKLYVNNADPDLEKLLYMHECGHIIYDHIENDDMKAASVSSRIRAKFEEYRDWFDNDETFFEYFKKEIFNVIQDFEVNSKLFSKEEFETLCKLGSRVLGRKMRGCWPEDYGFPVGKTWKEYLSYVLDNFEQFLDGEKHSLSKKDDDNEGRTKPAFGKGENNDEGDSADGESQPGDGEADGNGDENENENGKPSKKGGKKGKGKGKGNNEGDGDGEASDGDGEPTEKAPTSNNGEDDSSRVARSDIGNRIRNSRFTKEELDEMKKQVSENLNQNKEREANRCDSEGMTRGGDGDASGYEYNKELNFDEIKRQLLKNVFNKKVINSRRDIMYNSNRRKSTGSVLIPKDISREEYRADDFFVIMDVSGSVSENLTEKTVAMFNELSSQFGRKSRIIFWDDRLVDDVQLNKVSKNYRGGSTDIAGAIDYLNKNYIKGNEKVFIISDFCDSLYDWKVAIGKSRSKNFYGICWEHEADLRVVKSSFNHIYYLSDAAWRANNY